MHESNRRANIALIGLALAGVLLFIFGAYTLAQYKSQHTEEGQAAAQYSAQDTRGEVSATCVQEPRTRTYRCTADVPIADQHDPNAEHDLRAQQDMARWAYAVALLSFGTLLATGAGIWLLWLTLEATRDAVATATAANTSFAEHSRRELRPYMVLEGLDPELQPDGKIRIKVRWRNTGKTPTRHARCNASFQYFPGPIPKDFAFPDKGEEHHSTLTVGPDMSLHSEGVVIPFATFKVTNDTDTHLLIWGWVEYCDILGDEPVYRSEFAAPASVKPVPKGTLVTEDEIVKHDVTFDFGGLRIGWLSYGQHNGADGDCFKLATPLSERLDGRRSD